MTGLIHQLKDLYYSIFLFTKPLILYLNSYRAKKYFYNGKTVDLCFWINGGSPWTANALWYVEKRRFFKAGF